MTTLSLRQEVLRLEEELKVRQWHEQQLAIADGCGFVCLPLRRHRIRFKLRQKLEKNLRFGN